MGMSESEHAAHLGLNQSKAEKLAELAAMKIKIVTVMPMAAIAATVMAWNILAEFDRVAAIPQAWNDSFNILLALIFGLFIRFSGAQLGPDLVSAFAIIVYINMLLALFNLIPVPPLDGSKVLSPLFGMVSTPLERAYDTFRLNFERLGIFSGTLLILLAFYFLAPYFSSLLSGLFTLLTGVSI